ENQEVALRKWFDRVQELAGRIQGDYTYVVDSPKTSGRQIVLLLAAPKEWEKYRADLMQELYAAVGAEAGDYILSAGRDTLEKMTGSFGRHSRLIEIGRVNTSARDPDGSEPPLYFGRMGFGGAGSRSLELFPKDIADYARGTLAPRSPSSEFT